jgi:hypothetical protein
MLTAVYRFLSVVSTLVVMRNGGVENDVSRALKLGAIAARGGEEAKRELEAATAKVQQLVDEDRALTADESAAIDASIESKLAAIAAVQLPED